MEALRASVNVITRVAERPVTARAADKNATVMLRADITCPHILTHACDTTTGAFWADHIVP
jgi:hypothetical protein